MRVDDYIEFLPYDVVAAAIDDDYVDNSVDNLSVHRRGILIVDDSENKKRVKCLRVTDNNTDGDKTRITDVDRLYAVSYTHLDVYKRQVFVTRKTTKM